MRNLAQYPVTTAEILECLRTLFEEISAEKRPGDMRPLLLRKAAEIVELDRLRQRRSDNKD